MNPNCTTCGLPLDKCDYHGDHTNEVEKKVIQPTGDNSSIEVIDPDME